MSLMRLLTSGKTLIGLQETRPRYRMTDPRALPKFGSGKNPFRSSSKADLAEKSQPVQIEAQALIGEEAQRSSPQPRPSPLGRGGIAVSPFGNSSQQSPRPQGESGPLTPALAPSRGEKEHPRQAVVVEQKSVEIAGAETLDMTARVEREKQKHDFAGTGGVRPVTDGESRGARENGPRSPALSPSAGERGKLRPVRQLKGAFRLSDWAERLGSLLPIRPRPARSAPRSMPQPQQGELSLSLDQVTVVRNDLSDSDVEVVAAKRPAKAVRSEVPTPELSEERTGEAAEPVGRKIAAVTAWGRATMQLFGAGKS